jgi:flagellar basal body-associated protein FliL
LILVIAAVVLLIALLFIVMFLISQGALAESVAALNRGENRRFSSAFGPGSLTSGACSDISCYSF